MSMITLAGVLGIDFFNGNEYWDTLSSDSNIIVDVDKTGFPLPIEILDISKILKIDKKSLENSQLLNIEVEKKEKEIIIKFIIKILIDKFEKTNSSHTSSIHKYNEITVEERLTTA